MTEPTFPMIVRKGSCHVKIYRGKNKGVETYYVCYYLGGIRKLVNFSDFERARKEAKFVADRLDAGESNVLVMTSADRVSYQFARRQLDPLGLRLETAAMEYAEAKKKLGPVPLWQAVDYFLEWGPGQLKKPVAEVVEELLTSKDESLVSDLYIKALRYAFDKFLQRFKGNILDIRGTEINEWLRGLGMGARSQNNMRQAIKSLFIYAMRRRYLPRDHDELSAVPVVKEPLIDTEVFTPAELIEILCFTPERMLPFMVIGAFAGVRHAELQRLEWTDLLLDRGYVVVRATQSKTGSRRLVPIQENLRVWLSRMQPGEREVCEVANMASAIALLVREINRNRRAVWAQANQVSEDQLKETMKAARKELAAAKAARSKQAHKNSLPPGAETSDTEGWTPFVWKQNALRHSFISYRLAENPNMAVVSFESGTSPQMVHRNYKALVNVAVAKEWFGITPEVVAQRKLQLVKSPEPSVTDRALQPSSGD